MYKPTIDNLMKSIPSLSNIPLEPDEQPSNNVISNWNTPIFKDAFELFIYCYCSNILDDYVSSNISLCVPLQLDVIQALILRLKECDKNISTASIQRKNVSNLIISSIETFQSTESNLNG